MKKALFVWGGWDGHRPKECTEAVAAALSQKGFEVDISDDMASFDDVEKLKTYDLIMPCMTMGEISNDQCNALMEAIKSGVGLAGFHGGMGDTFRSNTSYQFMMGGQFVGHPGGTKAEYTVNIVKTDDPIMEGIEDFEYASEQYYMHVDPSNEVLATTTFSGEYEDIDWVAGCVMPVVWKRPYGKGKVFFTSLGHNEKEFVDYPASLEILLRGMVWAAR